VTYNADNFLDKNRDPLSQNVIDCMKTSSVEHIRLLFADSAESMDGSVRSSKSHGYNNTTGRGVVAVHIHHFIHMFMTGGLAVTTTVNISSTFFSMHCNCIIHMCPCMGARLHVYVCMCMQCVRMCAYACPIRCVLCARHV